MSKPGKDNIIQMRSHLTLQGPSQKQNWCHHQRITVVEDMRLLLCNDCQLWMEPFDYLIGWAKKDWAAEQIAIQHREEVKQLFEKKIELKRDIRNMKAKLKRLSKP